MWNIALALALSSTLTVTSAAILPKGTVVKMLDPEGFKKAMKANETSMVAFVAPRCDQCERMAPEYSKAALGLYPFIPTYAVDCDNDANKRLCAEEGAEGLPTVKLYPRGKYLESTTFESEQTASGFFYWASRRVPNHVKRIGQTHEIQAWVEESAKRGHPRALLLNKDKKIPLLWTVLGNKFGTQIELASHRDRKGKTSVALGFEAGEPKSSKVLIYPAGSTVPVLYQGITKVDSLTKFFDSVIDGTASDDGALNIAKANQAAAEEEFVPDEAELEIQRKQDAQKIALAHGGFASLIDFEEALKNGHNPHGSGSGSHGSGEMGGGYPGMMGDIPKWKSGSKEGTEAETETAQLKVEIQPGKGEEESQTAFEASPAEEPKPAPAAEPSETSAEEWVSETRTATALKDEL